MENYVGGKIACPVGAQYIGPVQWNGNVMVSCVLCCIFTVTADAIYCVPTIFSITRQCLNVCISD